ncbi:hypothetical protein DC498_17695 [Terrimonas sp.]|uniref:Lin1244/Lin1753 domain-containing protein n=1 Tax=Terrimonas sp. TaxID=1914338 RepID=UPI000D514D01|nr:Lin1244/Lin1753 domain-containing protein [Terrimonas sp.]PVD50806.1 hypothetical protein DC498_17695 [Terrimonas sp.]
MAKDAFWFKHDSNASADPKMVALVAQYGMAGKGMYWTLIEILREQENYRYNIAQKFAYASLADALKLKTDDCKNFINDLVNEFELLKSDGESIWSDSLLRRMSEWDTKKMALSERGRRGAVATNAKKAAQANEQPGTSDQKSRLSVGTSEKKASYKIREEEIREEEIRSECENKNAHAHTSSFFENSFRKKTEFEAFAERIANKYPSVAELEKPFTEEDFNWLTNRYSDRHVIDFILQAMENDPKLVSKNKSALHAFKKYIANEKNQEVKKAMAVCDQAWEQKKLLKKNEPDEKMVSEIPPAAKIVYPFGGNFLNLWQQWKNYLNTKEKTYKSVQEEQAALNLVSDYSGGDENKAVEIILTAMHRGWKGFYRPQEKKEQQPTGANVSAKSLIGKIMNFDDP